jgi:hypothetical protein
MKKSTDIDAAFGVLRFIAEMTKALTWPILIFFTLVLFRNEISQLTKRARTVEIAGTKSEFVDYDVVFGRLKEKVDELVASPNKETQERLHAEITQTTKAIQGLHPLALGILIDIGGGAVGSSAWQKEYLQQLQDKGYVVLRSRCMPNGDPYIGAELTKLGDKLLSEIGYANRKASYVEDTSK